jgi:uncharacterized protein with HEPN domain
MPFRSLVPRLLDMVEAIERVREVTASVSLDEFEQDWAKRWLVERGVEIVSEASRHLPEDLKQRHVSIPWRKVAGIGNVLRHAYEHVAADILWKLAQDDLTPLEAVCRLELARARAEDQGSS